jgi:hypothetical protein
MKNIVALAAAIVMLAQPALAQKNANKTVYASTATPNYENPVGTHQLYGALGFFSGDYSYVNVSNDNRGYAQPISGLFAIGADYEYMMREDFGLGGLIRYYSSKDSVDNNTDYEYTQTSFGPFARFHFPHRWFDFSFSTGLAFHTVKGETKTGGTTTKGDSGLKVGPMWSLQVMFNVSPSVALGVETLRIMTLGSEFNGMVSTDYVFKGKFEL